MKQMTLIEMDGFLKGKCIPRDLKVNETNAEYLVRKFGELEAKCAALAACGAKLKNPDNWLSHSDYGYEAAEVAAQNGATDDESLRAGMVAIINRMETPATDDFLAEVRAQGVEMAIEHMQKIFGSKGEDGDQLRALEWLAQAIRKGGAA